MAERSATMRNLALTCGFYTLSSAGMSVFNKMAIMALPLPITLVMVQMVRGSRGTHGAAPAHWQPLRHL
tara:strand:+ start:477 stop:683 length:207 start_codon:yes stop_codon:yes gene_type:complete